MRGQGQTRRSQKLWHLGASEYLPKNGHGDARTWARWHFLQVIARRAPEVLVDLRTRARSATSDTAVAVFVQYWHLPPWTMPYVESTWRFALEHPSSRLYWIDRRDLAGALVFEDSEEDSPAPIYDPMTETAAAYRERVEIYIAERELACRSRAVAKRPRKAPQAFEWLVQHLVKRKTYADIWKTTATINSRNTVRNACVDLLSFLADEKDAQK